MIEVPLKKFEVVVSGNYPVRVAAHDIEIHGDIVYAYKIVGTHTQKTLHRRLVGPWWKKREEYEEVPGYPVEDRAVVFMAPVGKIDYIVEEGDES